MNVFPRTPASVITRLDPRTRLVVALVFGLTVSFSLRPMALAVAVAVSLSAAHFARLDWRRMGKVLFTVNLFLLFLTIGLSLDVFATGNESFLSRDGFELGAAMIVRSNAILLVIAALLGSMAPAHLGLAMHQLRIPSRFTQTFLFMIRYIEVIHQEYHRLRSAMVVRGFRPRWNRRTLQTYGYLIGMLLVRSFDRVDRIQEAMKCRGFRGRFHVLFPFRFGRQDVLFAMLSTAVIVSILALDVPQQSLLSRADARTTGIELFRSCQ
jgi:cobalt/nickel transport system permease protein